MGKFRRVSWLKLYSIFCTICIVYLFLGHFQPDLLEEVEKLTQGKAKNPDYLIITEFLLKYIIILYKINIHFSLKCTRIISQKNRMIYLIEKTEKNNFLFSSKS